MTRCTNVTTTTAGHIEGNSILETLAVRCPQCWVYTAREETPTTTTAVVPNTRYCVYLCNNSAVVANGSDIATSCMPMHEAGGAWLRGGGAGGAKCFKDKHGGRRDYDELSTNLSLSSEPLSERQILQLLARQQLSIIPNPEPQQRPFQPEIRGAGCWRVHSGSRSEENVVGAGNDVLLRRTTISRNA